MFVVCATKKIAMIQPSNISFMPIENTLALTGIPFKVQSRKRKIVSELSKREEITINEIADILNISVPTATELTVALVEEGILQDTGKKSEGVGRKAAIFSLSGKAGYFLGVEIKKYKLNIGLMGFNKKMVSIQKNIPFPFLDTNDSLDAIITHIRSFIDSLEVPADKILGIGLSIAGRINVKTGQILTIYHFADAPIKSILEEALGLPVYIDNDSRTLAYGEFHFGRHNNEKNVLIVNQDYGLAAGVFVDGKPLYGCSGYAGELGHIPIFENEKICFCGKKGCLETEASGAALIRWITNRMSAGSNSSLQKILNDKTYLELEDIVDAVKKGDNLAIEGVTAIAEKLGKGLAIAINLFNPELIVLGGLLSAVGEPLLLPVKTAIFQHSLSIVNNDTRLEISSINDRAGLPGCCLLVRDKILDIV
jgi:predicted NBD/HSP70 family sugar kinase